MKRNAGRFTLQFNMEVPGQARAASYLNQIGRVKAHVIAELICAMLDGNPDAMRVIGTESTTLVPDMDNDIGEAIQLNNESDADETLNEALSDNLSLWE